VLSPKNIVPFLTEKGGRRGKRERGKEWEEGYAPPLQPAAKNKKSQLPEKQVVDLIHGRDDWIRTSDLVVPNDARYRAALHPVV
jgi:hypothetical protein